MAHFSSFLFSFAPTALYLALFFVPTLLGFSTALHRPFCQLPFRRQCTMALYLTGRTPDRLASPPGIVGKFYQAYELLVFLLFGSLSCCSFFTSYLHALQYLSEVLR